ncbi:MAG TPA: GNAT family N-acetyltransferase [Kofleriaceae bacterium]|nr:GNAT family N-acetyltransferase [Kofleriaceae bacterium]
MPRVFTADYVEHATLRDGTQVILRLVEPADKELLLRGFENWSAESRYARFFVPKLRLTDDELTYLCDVDQENHFAFGAIREGDGEPRGLGIARFIRLADVEGQPVTAEAAIAVCDEMQGKGLGRILFERLVPAAAERGIERFRFEVLGQNTSMKQLIDTLAPVHTTEVGGGVMCIDFALTDANLYGLFKAAATK